MLRPAGDGALVDTLPIDVAFIGRCASLGASWKKSFRLGEFDVALDFDFAFAFAFAVGAPRFFFGVSAYGMKSPLTESALLAFELIAPAQRNRN